MNEEQNRIAALSAVSTSLKEILRSHAEVLKKMSDDTGIDIDKISQMSEEEYMEYFNDQDVDMKCQLSFFSGTSFVLGNLYESVEAVDEQIDALVNGVDANNEGVCDE